MKLNKDDKELIKIATEIVEKNCDIYIFPEMHVGCIIKAKSGKIYKGINIKTSHAICAEQVALGQALACGEREFETIVVVKMNADKSARVISPCGLCRYTFNKLGLDINVILDDVLKNKIIKIKMKELLPYPYESFNTKK